MKRIVLLIMVSGLSLSAFAGEVKIDSTLQEFTGRYVFPPGGPTTEAQVGLDQGSLFISSQIGASTLQRVQGDMFSLVEYNGTAEFFRNDKGKVTRIRVIVQDIDATGTKEEAGAKLYFHPLRILPRTELNMFDINVAQ